MTEYTKEQELIMVYDCLLAEAEEVHINPVVAEFSDDIEKQLKDFEEKYPEIVSEYYFKHK